jgi:hypothetical protein
MSQIVTPTGLRVAVIVSSRLQRMVMKVTAFSCSATYYLHDQVIDEICVAFRLIFILASVLISPASNILEDFLAQKVITRGESA